MRRSREPDPVEFWRSMCQRSAMTKSSETDPRLLAAAANNADLYSAIFDAQGLAYTRSGHAFVARDDPPPYYSDVTILRPDHASDIRQSLSAKSEADRISFKDSFSEPQLALSGFRILFEASWIWRESAKTEPSDWSEVTAPSDLRTWEDAWKQNGSPTPHHMFRPGLLDRSDVVFLFKASGDKITAGCIANASAGCVGISNVFGSGPKSPLFREAASAVAARFPASPLTGYESGASLTAAEGAGFTAIGSLRIWVSDP